MKWKKELYESILSTVAKEVKRALNEEVDTTSEKAHDEGEKKMDDWHKGFRKENVKLCSDEKLKMYYEICKRKKYAAELHALKAEADRRKLVLESEKVDKKKQMYESVMSVVSKEVKKALNESLFNEVDEIREAIKDWARNNMNSSGWDNYSRYCEDMKAMMVHGNDPLVDACYNDIEELFPDMNERALKTIIDEVLAKESEYYLDTVDPEDFDDYDSYNSDDEDDDIDYNE